MTTSDDIPLCSRTPNPDRDSAPIRLDLPMNLVSALDGLAHIDRKTRKDLCETAVRDYIERRLHEFNVVLKMAGRNAVVSDSGD